MKKLNKLLILSPIVATAVATIPLVSLTSCGGKQEEEEQTGGDTGGGGSVTPVTYYTVSYNEPTGLTWTSKKTKVAKGGGITAIFSLKKVTLDWENSVIMCGTNNIKDSCSYTSTSINIPGSCVTGNITVNLATEAIPTKTYNVAYDIKSDEIQMLDGYAPATINTGEDALTAYFKIVKDGYTIDVANCKIMSGEENITQYAVFATNYVWIETEHMSGDLTITLAIKEDTWTDDFVESISGGTATHYNSTQVTQIGITASAVANFLYIAPTSSSNGSVDITLKGDMTDTQVIIKDKGTYNITLDNCSISNTDSEEEDAEAPLLIDAKKATVNIILKSGTTNSINDVRTNQISGTFNNDQAIKCKGTLTIKGSGTLNVNNKSKPTIGCYGKGIQITKGGSLTIDETAKVNVFALDTAIQAAGTINLTGNSTVVADSYYDDGIKTKFDDPTDDIEYAGGTGANKTRDITISGNSNVTVYAARNAINAAHDYVQTGSPIVNLYTSTRAKSKGGAIGTVTLDEQNMFVAIPADNDYNKYTDINNYYYTVTFQDSTATLKEEVQYMTLKKIKSSEGGPANGGPTGSGSTYWYFKCDRPLAAYDQLLITKYPKAQFGQENPEFTAITTTPISYSFGTSTNTNDTIVVSSISNRVISTSGGFSANYKKMIGQSSSIETLPGSKGVKSRNAINISGGTLNADTVDTSITAGYGDIFTNSVTGGDITVGSGDINISGGTITATSSSGDGVKANGAYTITGGTVEVTNAVEALEAGLININGGVTKLKATDDGVNASQLGKYQTYYSTGSLVDIQVTAGVLDVQITKSGDTDAIDSNKGMTISGGLVVTRNMSAGMASALDTEEAVVMTGGTLVALGNIEKGTGSFSTSSASTTVSIYEIGNFNVTYYNTATSSRETYKFINSNTMSATKKIYYSGSAPTFAKA